MNIVCLVGRVGRDPELRTTQGGGSVATLSVATNRSEKKGDKWEEVTDWHRCVAFGKTAEAIGRFLQKGSLVSLHGQVRYRSWEKDGEKKTSTEIVIDRIDFLGGTKPKGEAEATESQPDADIPF